MTSASPRIAVLGFAIECNRFSPVTTAADFASRVDIRGAEIVRQARTGPCKASPDLPGFFNHMDQTGPWTPVPLRLMMAQPGGPADQDFFDEFLDEIDAGLAAAGTLDGVFIVAHGAALSTESDDPDGDLFERVRQRVGPDVPIIGVFDLHANVSEKMIANLDVFVGYLENPHTDIRERGIEAAVHMRAMHGGMKTAVAMVKLPLVPPSIALLTAEGPYHDIIRYGQTRLGGDIINVSIMAGFVFSDCPKNGFAAVVTARNRNRTAALELARDIGRQTWDMRERFYKRMTPLDDAVRQAVRVGADASAPALLLADVADNPGGGGRGNTTWLLEALVKAQARGVVIGVFNDPPLASQAHEHGIGATFEAHFNRSEGNVFSQPFSAHARVIALSDGVITGRHGMMKGIRSSMGLSALLRIAGVDIAVISNRQQCLDPVQLETLGVDLAATRSLVVKSRGHFRAGFNEFFSPGQIVEVDCPGLTSPSLHTFAWTRLPRPVYPIDPETTWVPPTLPARH